MEEPPAFWTKWFCLGMFLMAAVVWVQFLGCSHPIAREPTAVATPWCMLVHYQADTGRVCFVDESRCSLWRSFILVQPIGDPVIGSCGQQLP